MKRTTLKRKTPLRSRPKQDGKPRAYHKFLEPGRKPFSQLKKRKPKVEFRTWTDDSERMIEEHNKQCLKRKKRMKQRTKKRSKQEKEYQGLRSVFLAEHPFCKVCQDMGIKNGETFYYEPMLGSLTLSSPMPATDVHHMGRREGKWLTDARFFLPVCRPHHDFIEKHGDWARAHGYLLTQAQLTLHPDQIALLLEEGRQNKRFR